jgi:hypothetical protein
MASKIDKTNPFQTKNLLFYFLFICLTTVSLQAQTTIISPTGAGGFELGATFASNGWTATTGTATQNQWTCNTGATVGFSGTYAAYITNNTAGVPPTHSFTINATRVSHIYRNFTYSNSLFYRPGQTPVDVESIQRNRMWVDLIDANGNSDRTLVDYIEGATMDKDSFFDCKSSTTAAMSVYTQIGNESFIIQGRALPFEVTDEIPVGMHLPTTGSYSLAIAGVDGLFDTQNIYLKDNALQLIHNLKTTPYQFAAEAGNCTNRFQLVFTNGALGASQFELNNTIHVATTETIHITSSKETIQSVVIYDVLGRKLAENRQVNAKQLLIGNLQKNNTALLVEVTTLSGARIIKKIIY